MLSAFATEAARRIVGYLYLNPERAVPLRDVEQALDGVVEWRSVIRTLNKLIAEGIVVKESSEGGDPVYRANSKHYLYDELRSIALKTLGGHDRLSKILATDSNIERAAIFGSFAKDTASAHSDIDLLLVVRNHADPQLFDMLGSADEWAASLGREINPKLYTTNEFPAAAKKDPFLRKVLGGPLIVLKGDWSEWTDRAGG